MNLLFHCLFINSRKALSILNILIHIPQSHFKNPRKKLAKYGEYMKTYAADPLRRRTNLTSQNIRCGLFHMQIRKWNVCVQRARSRMDYMCLPHANKHTDWRACVSTYPMPMVRQESLRARLQHMSVNVENRDRKKTAHTKAIQLFYRTHPNQDSAFCLCRVASVCDKINRILFELLDVLDFQTKL